jgi:hypothetical protein
MPAISEAEKQRRRQINASVIGSHEMEGLPPDAETIRLLDRYAKGELSREQLSAALTSHAMSLAEALRGLSAA